MYLIFPEDLRAKWDAGEPREMRESPGGIFVLIHHMNIYHSLKQLVDAATRE